MSCYPHSNVYCLHNPGENIDFYYVYVLSFDCFDGRNRDHDGYSNEYRLQLPNAHLVRKSRPTVCRI